MSDGNWQWYFTPSIGSMGGAVEIEEIEGNPDPISVKVRNVALVFMGPNGEIGFMPWVPVKVDMCDPESCRFLPASCILYEAKEHAIRALNDLFAGEKSRIIRPGMNGPRFNVP